MSDQVSDDTATETEPSRPRSMLGALFTAVVVAVGMPVLLAAATFSKVAERVSLPLWMLGALVVGALLLVPAFRFGLAPLFRAERSLSRYLGDRLPGGAGRLGVERCPEMVEELLEALAERAALLGELATVDSLTGLPNRLAAIERLRHALHLSKRDDMPLMLALLDIDDLAAINSQHGYGLGDKVISGVAHRLEQLVRESDWASRWGEDEFLVVLYTDPGGTTVALERIIGDLRAMKMVVGEETIKCTVTVGAARVRAGDDPLECLERAAAQLAKAKSEGAGGFSVQP